MASYELVSGQRLWEINIAGISTPWVAGEWVFVVTSDAKLLCVARATGKIRWISQLRRWEKEKKKANAIRWTGPVLAGGRLILVSTRGDLNYVDPTTGNIQSDVDMDRSMSLSPVVANNTLYILADDGKLTALVNVGPANPREYAEVTSTTEVMRPLVTATGGDSRRILDRNNNVAVPRVVPRVREE
jgi:outer membrane protein assembly factor BamB